MLIFNQLLSCLNEYIDIYIIIIIWRGFDFFILPTTRITTLSKIQLPKHRIDNKEMPINKCVCGSAHVLQLVYCWTAYHQKRMFKQWWLSIPLISSKRTISSHHNLTQWTQKSRSCRKIFLLFIIFFYIIVISFIF